MNSICSVLIKNYRSVENLEIKISPEHSISSICGENNVGKTNILRAINLFFNPSEYKSEEDRPQSKIEGRWGKKGSPVITINFLIDGAEYEITRDFRKEEVQISGLEKAKKGKELSSDQCEAIVKKFVCKFVPVLNLSIPKLINEIVEDMYDSEYETARFSGIKADLKKAYDLYTKGLLSILKDLAGELTPTFQVFNPNWEADVTLSENVNTFRELISDELELFIKDKSNQVIANKGSGLQRLTYILILGRIIEKVRNKTFILLLDEPDAYMHQGLQKKLAEYLVKLTQNSKLQLFLTTHSTIFIDVFHLRNVFLIGLELHGDKKQNIRSIAVDLDTVQGEQKIREQLGIEVRDHLPLDRYNVIFEGECDLHYFDQLSKYFGINLPKKISANGVDNIPKLLDYYNSQHSQKNMPNVLIILDDDSAGRSVFQKIKSDIKKYVNLKIKCILLPNHAGEGSGFDTNPDSHDKNYNSEVEDFIFPELFCELANSILTKKKMNNVKTNEVVTKIKQPAFKSRGILALFDYEKNHINPTDGHTWTLLSSGNVSNHAKSGIAHSFNIQGSKQMIKRINDWDKQYPEVRKFLDRLKDFEKLFV
jgi:AAA15 family ATPase/GTPase